MTQKIKTRSAEILEEILKLEGTFTFYDISAKYKNAGTYVRNLVTSGELIIVGKTEGKKSRHGVNIYLHKSLAHLRYPWSNIFPEYFTEPKIAGIKRTVIYDENGRKKETKTVFQPT